MTTTKALAKLYKTITGSEARNSIGRILSDLADNWSTSTAPSAATKTKAGVVKMAAKVNEAAGTEPTAAEFKALLDALKDAGIMAES